MRAEFSNTFNCFKLEKTNGYISRSFRGGYTDIRDYDLIRIEVNNETEFDTYVPILLFVQKLANPTGLCPILCNTTFEPTGIYVQLSKNWHNKVSYLFSIMVDSMHCYQC